MIWDHWQSSTQQAHACVGDGPITVFLLIDSISSAMTQTATGGQGFAIHGWHVGAVASVFGSFAPITL